MHVKTKQVYYCEYCNRHRLTPNSILKHEKGCTANPDRTCRVCGNKWQPDLLAKYKDQFIFETETGEFGFTTQSAKWIGKSLTLDELRSDTDGCPVCILAVIRQCSLNNSPGDFAAFDYQKEHKEYWDERNASYDGYCDGPY